MSTDEQPTRARAKGWVYLSLSVCSSGSLTRRWQRI